MVIGLTGSIGTGKSTVSEYLKDKGYCVVDADELSHQALEKNTETYHQIVELFDCLNDDLTISRPLLAKIVFNDEHKRKQLESIIHPFVINRMQQIIKKESLVFLDVPLLFESHLESMCDYIVVVSCEENLQISRIISRDHCLKIEALKRIKAQMPLSLKEEKADYIIYNNDDLSSLKNEVERFLNNEVIHF